MRAGEGESEASGTVLTNPVWKTSTYSGLSTRGRAQVRPFFSHILVLCSRLAGSYQDMVDVSLQLMPGRLLTHVLRPGMLPWKPQAGCCNGMKKHGQGDWGCVCFEFHQCEKDLIWPAVTWCPPGGFRAG